LSYGVSDFLGAIGSRRVGTLQFLVLTQVSGLVLAAGWVAISSDPIPPGHALLAAAGAGLGVTIGVFALFQAMVVGKVSVVAPISATGVVLPVAIGIARGEHPTVVQAVGIIAAIAGVVLAARTRGEDQVARGEAGLGLAVVAAVGTGLFLWLMAPASQHGVAWAVLIARVVPSAALVTAVCIIGTSLRPALEPRTAGIVLAAAVLAFVGVALYGAATLHGQLVIVSVLGSLYPVVIVLLAYRVLGERLDGAQRVGVVAVLCGVVLLSA
jgi:drug/metabolite transporter (DMT)-like permease